MGGNPIPGPLDSEHILDTMISDLKALQRAIPQMILVLSSAKAKARREASGRGPMEVKA